MQIKNIIQSLHPNTLLNNLARFNSTDFLTTANDTSLIEQQGIIETVYPVNDSVYAVIRKDYPGKSHDHGDGLFNANDGADPEKMTRADLAVKTNIVAINAVIERYVGARCIVTVKNGIAVYAKVNLGEDNLTVFPPQLLGELRATNPDNDLFTDKNIISMKDLGYSEQEIDNLKLFTYTPEEKGKIVYFKDEASWSKDVAAQQKENELNVTNNPIIRGLNKLGMKTKKCHIPTRLFSGK